MAQRAWMLDKDVVRICVAECRSVLGDKARNIAAACAAICEASHNCADLIVLPELFITGYDVGEETSNLAEAAEPDCNSAQIISEAALNNQIAVIYGFPERNDSDMPYNSANLIGSDGLLIGTYRKTHLFGDEDQYFEAGTEYPVFDTPVGKIGIMICYDVEFPEPARYLAENGADYIVAISANMQPYTTEHKLGIPMRARENSIHIAYCNYTGRDRKHKYCGQSVIVDRSGAQISCPASVVCEQAAVEGLDEEFTINDNSTDCSNYGMRLMYADIDIRKG